MVRIEAPRGGDRVELYGEIGDWITPVPVPGGAATLALPPGVYAYKFKIDGAWTLDPRNERTRVNGEHRNSILSVDGAPEPLLFAAAPPFVRPGARGGVVVTAALRAGAGDALAVRWSEGHGERRAAMQAALDEGEHRVFRALLPISGDRATLAFELADGTRIGREDDPGSPFTWERPRGVEETPAWWRDAVIYAVLVDRFRAARDDAPWGVDPGPNRPAGGHLDGLRRSLGDLASLGVNTLYLTPIHRAASCHRYDVVDPLAVDPALGGDEALDRLLDEAHRRGMRVILDLSFSHAGRGFPAYEEVIAHGPSAPQAGWFQWIDGDPPRLRHYGSRTDAPLFNLQNPEVRELALQAAAFWASRGADGLRLDAAAEVPIDLARAVRAAFRAIRPDGVVFGELVPRHAHRWLASGALDAATDFGFHAAATDFLARGAIDAAEMRRRLAEIEVQRGAPAEAAVRFLSTHDHPRFATLARLDGGRASADARTHLGLALLLTSPGVPAILYGEEIGLFTDAAGAPEDVWPDRAPMPWDGARGDERARHLVKRLLALRASSPALRRGDCEVVYGEGPVLVYRRSGEGEVIDVAINAGDEALLVELADDAMPGLDPLIFVGDASADGETATLGPRSAIVARRRRVESGRRGVAIAENERLRDEEIRQRAAAVRSRPTWIDFAITERCELQCRHCIAAAPERTRSGLARTLAPWIVDRLREDLGFTARVGFNQGGEPLAAPILFDLLAALREARAGAPTAVHLLTNGMLLDGRMAARLADGGVTSIAVSLDGATARTNDFIRAGSRFEVVVGNLREAIAMRRRTGARLWIGVTTVVTRDNAGELTALSELCAEVGVDGIAFEELVPVSAFAERSLVRLDGGPVRAALEAAVVRAGALGIEVEDRTAGSGGLGGRALWDRACIEPDGGVILGDFLGVRLGSVAEESLAELWRGPIAMRERERARRARR